MLGGHFLSIEPTGGRGSIARQRQLPQESRAPVFSAAFTWDPSRGLRSDRISPEQLRDLDFSCSRCLPRHLILSTEDLLKMDNFWQLGDELRGQLKVSEDNQWSMMTSKLAELTKSKGERMNYLDPSRTALETKVKEKFGFQEDNKFENLNLNIMNLDFKMNDTMEKGSFRNGMYTMGPIYQKNNFNDNNATSFKLKTMSSKYMNNNSKENNNYNSSNKSNNNNNNSNNHSNNNNSADKRFKTLPSTEMLPRNEVLGGYIFVCNNDTMQEDLKRQLFGKFLLRAIFVKGHCF
ncbi:hypothetical protein Taro_035688 [Colocasia esculenta]|uniref:DCD domain-containing protein n=1 Tax=Colocasia esculenta TaxID=4460 RepID=A0A843WFJ7_COLES|nr:hypothetical protein [Colocasia esculenta]